MKALLAAQVVDFVRQLSPEPPSRVRRALRDLGKERGHNKGLETPMDALLPSAGRRVSHRHRREAHHRQPSVALPVPHRRTNPPARGDDELEQFILRPEIRFTPTRVGTTSADMRPCSSFSGSPPRRFVVATRGGCFLSIRRRGRGTDLTHNRYRPTGCVVGSRLQGGIAGDTMPMWGSRWWFSTRTSWSQRSARSAAPRSG
jgi:hypothetical protein